MADDFTGGVAVITGAGSGIGAGIAKEAGRRNMKVVVSDIARDKAESVAAEITRAGGQAQAMIADVRDPAAVQALADAVHQKWGDVRLLVNNAGVTVFGPSWELTPDQWHDALNINLNGIIHGVCAFVPRMAEAGRKGKRGAVVNLSSLGGLTSLPLTAPYTVSKHAALAFSECLYLEMSIFKLPIDVSVVVPGLVDTPIYKASIMSHGGTKMGEKYREVMQGASTAQGMPPDEAGRVIFKQIESREFWISTDSAMTKETASARADFIRAQGRPQLPPALGAALAKVAAGS